MSWKGQLRAREIVTNGTKIGEVDGNLFQFPTKFVVMNATSTELMHLEGKVLSIRDQFTFFDPAGAELGTMKKKIFKPRRSTLGRKRRS